MSSNISMKRSKSSPSRGWNKHKFCIFAWTNNYSTTWWIVLALLWWQTQSWLLTCHGSLDVQQVLLGTQDCGALSYEPQSHRLLHAALLGEVSFQHVHFGLPLAVKHLFSCQPVTGGERDSCGDEKKKTSYLQCFNIPFIEKWGVNSTSLSKRHSSCLISKYQGIDSLQEGELVFTPMLPAHPLRQFTRLLLWAVSHSVFNIYTRPTQFLVCLANFRANEITIWNTGLRLRFCCSLI